MIITLNPIDCINCGCQIVNCKCIESGSEISFSYTNCDVTEPHKYQIHPIAGFSSNHALYESPYADSLEELSEIVNKYFCIDQDESSFTCGCE